MQQKIIKQYLWVAFIAFIVFLPIVGFVIQDGAISATQWKLWYYQTLGKSPSFIANLLDISPKLAQTPVEIPFRVTAMLLLCGLSVPGAMLWKWLLNKKNSQKQQHKTHKSLVDRIDENKKVKLIFLVTVTTIMILFPWVVTNDYQVTIFTTALMYVVLGLGLNIVVGMAGLLDLGFIAFAAVGAYTYGLLNVHYGVGFWLALPLGGAAAALFGIILGAPILRLREDYLAIVTLGFGEIIRLVLNNWVEVTRGAQGISNIDKPSLFGIPLNHSQESIYLYYIILGIAIITIFVIIRLANSRIGRAWVALREDEIACRAMGINPVSTKLLAFSLGALWGGFAGVFFAAKNSFINPEGFNFIQSALVLCIVVLGGMGSIIGVVLAGLFLFLVPEYLRDFEEYRMLAFGAILVIMMVFKPKGLFGSVTRKYVGQS